MRQATPSDRRQDVLVMTAALVVLSCLPRVVVGQSQSPAGSGDAAQLRDLRKLWKSERSFREKVTEQDRKELVTPPAEGFTPTPKAHPTLTVKLRSLKLKSGEHLSYALSLTNRGAQPIQISDRRAFLKRPRLTSTIRWQFWVTGPDGKEFELVFGDTADLAAQRARRLPQTAKEQAETAGNSSQEARARQAWEADAEESLDVVLRPGETIHNRACAKPLIASGAGPGYCDFPSDQTPLKPGRYTLKVVMNDRKPSLEGDLGKVDARFRAAFERAHRHHLGRIESNRVDFEVVR
jgi:hypothetical protein